MKLRWARPAIADRGAIFAYLVERSPQAAILVDERIEDQTRLLLDFPMSGRAGRVDGTRELVVAVYQIEAEAVRILRVIHGARRWPPVSAR